MKLSDKRFLEIFWPQYFDLKKLFYDIRKWIIVFFILMIPLTMLLYFFTEKCLQMNIIGKDLFKIISPMPIMALGVFYFVGALSPVVFKKLRPYYFYYVEDYKECAFMLVAIAMMGFLGLFFGVASLYFAMNP